MSVFYTIYEQIVNWQTKHPKPLRKKAKKAEKDGTRWHKVAKGGTLKRDKISLHRARK